jgi:hypothetical protein
MDLTGFVPVPKFVPSAFFSDLFLIEENEESSTDTTESHSMQTALSC